MLRWFYCFVPLHVMMFVGFLLPRLLLFLYQVEWHWQSSWSCFCNSSTEQTEKECQEEGIISIINQTILLHCRRVHLNHVRALTLCITQILLMMMERVKLHLLQHFLLSLGPWRRQPLSLRPSIGTLSTWRRRKRRSTRSLRKGKLLWRSIYTMKTVYPWA